MDVTFDDLLDDQQVDPNPDNQEPQEPSPTSEPTDDGDSLYNDDDDVITSYLKLNGVKDPTKLQYEGDNGQIEEVNFSSLSKEEQLNILHELSDVGISEYETDVINYLRRNNATLEQVIDYFAEQRLQNYLNNHPEDIHQESYQIDDYSDDELYVADLKIKYPNFTDEELESKLNTAKLNDELFSKEVAALRQEYKAAEERDRQNSQMAEQQAYVDLQQNLTNSLSRFNEIQLDITDPESDALVIEDRDKQYILAYLLNQDQEGRSQFVKDIENPDALIELAWFRTQGRDIISGITKYWKDTLKAERKKIASLEKQLDSLKNQGNKTMIYPGNKKQDDNKKSPAESIWDNSGLI